MGNSIRNQRKIITNNDINDLLVFSRKNLGIYNLVYKKYKYLYFGMIINTLLSIMFLICYISSIDINVKGVEVTCFWGCLSFAVIALVFSFRLNKETRDECINVQNRRLEKLREYYEEREIARHDIIIISEQLRKRIEKINSNRITLIVILGVLILPIWEVFVERYFVEFSTSKLLNFLQISIVIAALVIFCIRIYNRWEYLYQENVYIRNNTHIMENLIYLNSYIINERMRKRRNGRRRRRR